MSTQAQIDANRANSAKSCGPTTPEGKRASAANAAFSTGPRTPEGKARSAQNAMKHGVLANSLTFPDENRDEFIRLLDVYKEHLQPADELEDRAIETMVFSDWRRRRIWTFEMARLFYATCLQETSADKLAERLTEMIPFMHASLAFSKMSDTGRTLDLVCRYDALMRNQYSRAFADLRHLQADRGRRQDTQIATQLSQMEASLDNGEFVPAISKQTEANLESGPGDTGSQPSAT